MNLSVDASDFAQLADYWRRAPDIVREELLRTMVDADMLLKGELMQELPAGAGGAAGLRGSLNNEEHMLADTAIGIVGTPLEYAKYVELGTKPHPVNEKGITALTDWVEAKLGLREEEAAGIANAIAWKIRRKGTKANPVWRTVWQAQQATLRAKFDAAIARIATRLAAQGAT